MTQKELQLIYFFHQFNNPRFMVALGLVAVWSIAWKGVALWKAARNKSTAWYAILLLFNTLGILEILYIFIFSKKEEK